MILVLSGPDDAHASHVCELLAAQGAALLRFDPRELPAAAALTFRQQGGEGRMTLVRGAAHHELGRVRATWYRRPQRPRAPETLGNPGVRRWVEQESLAFMRDLYRCLDCAWFPAAPHVIAAASHRLYQLQTAARLGLAIPETLVTTSPGEALEFYRRQQGRICSKLLSGPSTNDQSEGFFSYNRVVSNRDLIHLRSVASCPSLFQAYVEKQAELRVTVVDGEAFAAELDSQATNRTKQDWRRYDRGHTPHRAVTLPPDVRDGCLALTAGLGLRYGAIDLIRTPDGGYVFLEINPNGQYLWIELATGLPISRAICQALHRTTRPEAAA